MQPLSSLFALALDSVDTNSQILRQIRFASSRRQVQLQRAQRLFIQILVYAHKILYQILLPWLPESQSIDSQAPFQRLKPSIFVTEWRQGHQSFYPGRILNFFVYPIGHQFALNLLLLPEATSSNIEQAVPRITLPIPVLGQPCQTD